MCTVCVHFLLFIKMSLLHFPLSLAVLPKAVSNELVFMQVTADPVSMIQEKFFVLMVCEILGLFLSP